MRALRTLVTLALVCALCLPLYAAVTPNSYVTAQTPKNGTVTFVQGTDGAGTYKTLYTGGTNGTKIVAIWVTSNDGSASHLVTIQLSTSTSAHCSPQSNCVGGAAVTVPVNSGFANGAGAVNFMSATNWPGLPIDSNGQPYLNLSGNTQTLEATFATALTASTQVAITVVTADY